MVQDPLADPVTETIGVPLYYTGLTGSARIRQEEGAARTCTLDTYGRTDITLTVRGRSHTWFIVE
jgi:hypothetical protein